MKLAVISVLALTLVLPVYTQQMINVCAGRITCAEGDVYLGDTLIKDHENSHPIVSQGQRLRTGSGRVEMELGPGSFLRMGEKGTILLEDSRFSDVRLQIESGSVLVEIFEEFQDTKIEARFKSTVIGLKDRGLYRFDAEDALLRVYGGKARLSQGRRKATVKRGKSADLENGLETTNFNLKQLDPLHEWAGHRSFDFFIEILKSNSYLDNWSPLFNGWAENENYGMRFYSQTLDEQFKRNISLNEWSEELRRQEREELRRQEQREQERQIEQEKLKRQIEQDKLPG